MSGFRPDLVTSEIIGFANSNNGIMAVCECPECFKKWHFHARDLYKNFILKIQFGEQRHFKNTEGAPPVLPKLIDPRDARKK